METHKHTVTIDGVEFNISAEAYNVIKQEIEVK